MLPYHCVWNLTAPERRQSLEETTDTFLRSDLRDTIKSAACERRHGSLHADFDGLKWTEASVCEDFGTG